MTRFATETMQNREMQGKRGGLYSEMVSIPLFDD